MPIDGKKQLQEQNAQLRRVRTEELLKRNRENKEQVLNSGLTPEYADIVKKVYSKDYSEVCNGVYEVRVILSQESNPPVQKILDLNILPLLVNLLDYNFYRTDDKNIIKNTMLEAAWALTNICTGTHEQTRKVVEIGASAKLVEMLKMQDDDIVDQSVWCLGNISGDCEEFRDILLNLNIVEIILDKLKEYEYRQDKMKIFRNLMWLAGNLNRGRHPPPDRRYMSMFLSIYERYVGLVDKEVVNSCFWGISYICDSDEELTNAFLNSNIYKKLVELITTFENNEIAMFSMAPIIRTLGNIVSEGNEQTEFVIQSGAINNLCRIFYSVKERKAPRIRKEICWLISNITAGPNEHVQFISSRDSFIDLLIDAMSNYEVFVRKEAVYAIYNITFNSETGLVRELMDKNICLGIKKCINACNTNTEIVLQLLDVCKNLLDVGIKIKEETGVDIVLAKFNDTRLSDVIEDCQDFRNDAIADRAYKLIMKYYDAEEDDNYY